MKKIKQGIAIILIMMLSNFKMMAQVDVPNHTWVSGYYVGWASANNLDFKMGTTPTQYMTFTSGGLLGIGTTFTPTYKLDVDAGDINVNTSTNCYRLGQTPFLWHNGNTTNVFCGVDAGNGSSMGDGNTFMGMSAGASNAGSSTTSGSLNTFIGSFAGTANTTGRGNTFLGRRAGEDNTSGIWNTFTGVWAGGQNTSGQHNSFYGKEAGYTNTTGSFNTFLGNHSGQVNTTGDHNVMVGYNSGITNDIGDGNTFVGVGSGGFQTEGNRNIAVGFEAGQGNDIGDVNIAIGYQSQGLSFPTDLNYTIALGANTGVEADYGVAIGADAVAVVTKSIILGDNDVNTGIGISNDATGPLAKLHVFRDVFETLLNPTAVYVENIDNGDGRYYSTGIHNITHGNNEFNTGIITDVYTGDNNTGISSLAIQSANETNIGGFFHADNGSTNFGVIGYAPLSIDASFNVGVYGEAPTNGGSPPWTAGVGSFAGYFNGDLAYTGSIGAASDAGIKTNIQPFVNAGSILQQINCYTYYYDSTKYGNHVNLPRTMQVGVLAQEVELATPGLSIVKDGKLPPKIDSLGHVVSPAQTIKMVDYVKIVPLLLAGYHELQTQIADLQAIIQSCCGSNRSGGTGQNENENNNQKTIGAIDVTLSSKTIVLNQNSPNPFKEQTTITYTIPEDAKNVKIIFTDSRGNVLKEVEITQTGNGQLNVYAQDLSSGIYSYSLVIDGVTIDTKKMVYSK